MDNITKWMVRGAYGAVILSVGFLFSYGSYAVIRGKQLIRDAAVTRAKADMGVNAIGRISGSVIQKAHPKLALQ